MCISTCHPKNLGWKSMCCECEQDSCYAISVIMMTCLHLCPVGKCLFFPTLYTQWFVVSKGPTFEHYLGLMRRICFATDLALSHWFDHPCQLLGADWDAFCPVLALRFTAGPPTDNNSPSPQHRPLWPALNVPTRI